MGAIPNLNYGHNIAQKQNKVKIEAAVVRLMFSCNPGSWDSQPISYGDKALAALEEAAEQSRKRPIQRTKALSFALAYLWALSGGERWPFVNFWRDIAGKNDIGRSQGVNASLNAIYLALGLRRDRAGI